MYYPKQKIAFIHIPKTGGSTLEYHLGQIEHPTLHHRLTQASHNDKMRFLTMLYKKYKLEPEDKRHSIHRMGDKYNEVVGPDWRLISLVRNPFSQIKSLYTMNKAQADKMKKPYPTWEEYIMEDVKRANHIFGQRHWLDYVSILSGTDREIEVYPFEHYHDVMNMLGEQLGFEFDPEVKLWSTKPQHNYTPEMIERVLDLYGDSYHLWQECRDYWREFNLPMKGIWEKGK